MIMDLSTIAHTWRNAYGTEISIIVLLGRLISSALLEKEEQQQPSTPQSPSPIHPKRPRTDDMNPTPHTPYVDWSTQFLQANASERHLVTMQIQHTFKNQQQQHLSTMPIPTIHAHHALKRGDISLAIKHLLTLLDQGFANHDLWLWLVCHDGSISAAQSSRLASIRVLPDFLGGSDPSRRNLARHMDTLSTSLIHCKTTSPNDIITWLEEQSSSSPLLRVERGIHFWYLVYDVCVRQQPSDMQLCARAKDWLREVGVIVDNVQ